MVTGGRIDDDRPRPSVCGVLGDVGQVGRVGGGGIVEDDDRARRETPLLVADLLVGLGDGGGGVGETGGVGPFGLLVGDAEPQHVAIIGVGGRAQRVQGRHGFCVGEVSAGVADRIGLRSECFEPVSKGRVVGGQCSFCDGQRYALEVDMTGDAQQIDFAACGVQQGSQGVAGRALGGGESRGHVAIGAVEFTSQRGTAVTQPSSGGQVRAFGVTTRGRNIVFGDDCVAAGSRGAHGLRVEKGLLELLGGGLLG